VPLYEFQCECGLQFEKLFKRITDVKTLPCPTCGNDAKKMMSASNFSFTHPPNQLNGMAPPSTGTSDDWNFDKAIGRDAEKKWADVEKRDSAKSAHIRQEHKAGKVISRNHLIAKEDGYRTITEKERSHVNQQRETVFQVSKALKKKSNKDI
jgi:putative FmdB family regulatory protein